MAEYIEKIELIEEMKKNSLHMFNSYYKGYVQAIKDVADFKKADVQPVNRGHWEENHATYIKQLDAWFVQAKCSCCGRYSDKMDNYSQYLDLEYCSRCGADMRETNNEVV